MPKKIIRIALFSFLLCVIVSAVWAQEFRFTCTADNRDHFSGFSAVLNQIKNIVGNEGAFHITPGDFDPADSNFSRLQAAFGNDVIWIPAMGNHDGGEQSWVESHNRSLPFNINWGPRDCDQYTTFSFDYNNAHFVILDEYCEHSGDIDDGLYNWLLADLHATQQPAIFVIGHEPAYPYYRHEGDSLDADRDNRDRFWQLLHDTGVVAYICGHTHDPSVHEEPGYDTLQIDVGQARGTGSHDSFFDVTVRDSEVEFKVYRGGSTPFYLWEHRIVQIEPSTPPEPPYDLIVNTQGQGTVDVDPPAGPYDYEEGKLVMLTAMQSTDWMFNHWEGDLSGAVNPEIITMDSPKTVTAVFSLVQPNQAPSVYAGPDQAVILPNTAILNGTVTDDGLPPPGVVTTTWSMVSGPDTVDFFDTGAVNTTAGFFTAGTYVLRLTADDDQLASFDELTVTVHPEGTQADTIEIRVNTGNDDAEESQSGSISRSSSDLELVYDGGNQKVGMRFNQLTIPRGAAISKAYIQFQVDETNSGATYLTIQGQNIGNAPSFSSSSGDISSRARTTASVSWEPVPWTSTGQAGPDQQTPDIAQVIQQIVSGPDWSSGNSLVIIITGTGERVAESYNGSSSGAPLLHVEYVTGPVANRAPNVDAGSDQTVTLPNGASLDATVTDDGLPSDTLTITWSMFSGPASVTFDDDSAVNTTVWFTAAGNYKLELTADDGELASSDLLSVTVNPVGTQTDTIEIRIETDNDDAEERSSGSMYLTSTDLELVYDSGNQKVGMRFNGVTIPQGAAITNAYIQFQADETHSGTTSLSIQGQDIGNAPAFSSSSGNISSRARTATSVSWEPVPWTSTGQAGPNQQTPDIASVIQEIVNRSDWFEGNSLVIIVTGTGERVAESYEGGSSRAPLLHVEYTMSDPNHPPTDITLLSNTVDENASGADIGQLTVNDPDDGDTHTFSVSDPRFEMGSNMLKLKPAQSLDYETGPSVELDVTATDSGGLPLTETFTVIVANVNEAPTDITLSKNTVYENADGAEIGQLTVSDQDVGDTHTFGVSDPRFEVLGNTLKLRTGESLDYETDPPVTLSVTATDFGGLSTTMTFTVIVLEINEAPTDITLSKNTVYENVDGAQIGQFTVSDPNVGDTHTFSVSDARFEVLVTTLKLKSAQSLDFEAEPSVALVVTATDSGGLSVTGTFTVIVLEINEAPTGITLSNDKVNENDSGAEVGQLTVSDQDVGDTHTFNLSDDRFEVVGDTLKLRTGESLDYETDPPVTLNVTATDSGGLSTTKTFTVIVVNVNEAPTAMIKATPATAPPLLTVDFDANGSSDPENYIVSYAWDFGDGATSSIDKTSHTYSTADTYTVELTVTDNGGLTDTATMNIAVSIPNRQPTDITLSNDTVNENASGAEIGQLSVIDPDLGDAHIFSFSDPRFEVVDYKLKLKLTQSLDFEAEPAVALVVTATDSGGLWFTKTFTVIVLDLNEAPTATIATTPGITPLTVDFNGAGSSDPENNIVSYTWDFGDTNTGSGATTSHTYNTSGTYTVTLTVTDNDGASNSDQITITVNPPITQVNTIEIRVNTGNDDAEESQSGSISRSSSDLELVYDGGNQKVGMRFNGATIPQGAAITNAYIQFQADETHSGTTSLTIQGQNIGNAPSFSSSSGNISSRARTTASVSWNPAPWTQRGQAGPDQQTPDFASVIQEIVNRLDWFEGNSLVIIITGTGERVAESYNGSSSGAPLLRVEYTTGPVANRAPIVDAGPDQTITLDNDATLDATVTDDGLPPGEVVTTDWSQVSGPGSVTFGNPDAVDTTATFSTDGEYVLRLTAYDSEFTPYDELSVTVYPQGTQANTIEIRVEADNDDAEERSSGSMYLTSTDLELVYDRSNQTVGMRFNGVNIPKGAAITNAYIQFQAEESHSGTTSLTIQGQNIDNAPIFSSSSGNISSRARTTAFVPWNPVPWTTGEAGPDQQTPNIALIIQQIVSRQYWSSGNSLVIIITGTGERSAESYDGRPSGAPLLHVEYHSP